MKKKSLTTNQVGLIVLCLLAAAFILFWWAPKVNAATQNYTLLQNLPQKAVSATVIVYQEGAVIGTEPLNIDATGYVMSDTIGYEDSKVTILDIYINYVGASRALNYQIVIPAAGGTVSLSASDLSDLAQAMVDAGVGGAISEDNAVDTFNFVVYDATNATTVGIAPVTIRTAGGQYVGTANTSINGRVQAVLLGDTSSYIVSTAPVLYNGADTTFSAVTGLDTVFVTKIDQSAYHSVVWADLGEDYSRALVTFTMPNSNVNSCDSSLFPRRSWTTRVGDNGLLTMALPYSSCFDSAEYTISIEGKFMSSAITGKVFVPDTSEYQIRSL